MRVGDTTIIEERDTLPIRLECVDYIEDVSTKLVLRGGGIREASPKLAFAFVGVAKTKF